MKPLRSRLQMIRERVGVPWEILERDYILSWLLVGINHVKSLRETLVFKGGTALKKCFFGDYRFSEDLDFSGIGNVPIAEEMERAIQVVCNRTASLLDECADVEIVWERYKERGPHPGGQEAFIIRVRLPWQRRPQTRIMIEIAVDEKVLKPFKKRSIIHEYGEPLETQVQVYALEEIVAEKLRAILQHIEKLQERGWSRSRARDYYDLWRIFGTYQIHLELSDFSSFLLAKCNARNVSFKSPNDFFDQKMINYVERTWKQWLGPLVPDLPDFKRVIRELRPQILALFSTAE